MNDINAEILEIFNEKQNYDWKRNQLMTTFLTTAYELVDLSQDLYQVEHTIKLNKISLKDYILNSDLCNILKERQISNYSISELKEFMNQYQRQQISDLTPYWMALELYEKLEEIESIDNEKIEFEMTKLKRYLEPVKMIPTTDKNNYQELYNEILKQVKTKYIENQLIDENAYNCILQVLNDIFNYYLYGNQQIPLENT